MSASSSSATSTTRSRSTSVTSRPTVRDAGRDHLEPRGGRLRLLPRGTLGRIRSRSTTRRSPASRRARPSSRRSIGTADRGSGWAGATPEERSRTPSGPSPRVGRPVTHRRSCRASRNGRVLLAAGRGGGRSRRHGDHRPERSRTVARLVVVDPPRVDRAHGAGPRRSLLALGGETSPRTGSARRASGHPVTSRGRRTSWRRWARCRTRRTRG